MSDTSALAGDPVDVVDVLPLERAELCRLLATVNEEQWAMPTECPAWTVKGIALHVLGDDLSLLARQRDAEAPSLLTETSLPSWDGAPVSVLDHFNERWVYASRFLSPELLIELLRLAGEWTYAWYSTVDPQRLGEEVVLFTPGKPSPYWAITAREYLERWVHHLQIRRALGLPAGPLGEPPLRTRAFDTISRALTNLFVLLAPAAAAPVIVTLGDRSWTYRYDDAKGWTRHPESDSSFVTSVRVDATIATTLLSRGLSRGDAEDALTITGDEAVTSTLKATMAELFSRYWQANTAAPTRDA